MSNNHFPGFSLIEIIIALGLFIIIVTGGILAFASTLNLNRAGLERTQAASLAQEGIEAVRSIRNQSFTKLTPGTHGIGISAGRWVFVGGSDTVGKFSRQIIIAPVSRDAGGTIVSTGGITDPDTILATARVKWNFTPGITNQVSASFYFTNWRKSTNATATPQISFTQNFTNSFAYAGW